MPNIINNIFVDNIPLFTINNNNSNICDLLELIAKKF